MDVKLGIFVVPDATDPAETIDRIAPRLPELIA